ncbi:MAG TPA: cytosine permease [Steroidobacter sp.]|uniref:cytosine permease n=1 Tax=Steroidobacter sp. TaxID=1978227 RepID=UPI002ED8F58D
MAKIDELTEDFALEPVPSASTVNGVRVAMVIVGFTITLPIFIAGSNIGLSLGFMNATAAFLGGGFILAMIGSLTAYIGAKTRLSTYVITQFSFGRRGARVANGVIAMALFGWYGVTAELFGKACQKAILDLYGLDLGVVPLSLVGSTLMVFTAIWGFKALDKLSVFAVPLMGVLLATAVLFALRSTSWHEIVATKGDTIGKGTATSLVVGSFIVGAILLPDLCRYARRSWEGIAAAAVSLGVIFPIVFYCAMIPSLATGKNDLVLIMIGLGIGLPALALLIFATWSTNSHNLYSTSLTLASLFPAIKKWKLTVVAGLAGTAIAAAGITDHFVAFLLLLGTSIPAIAGIYAADFFVISKQKYTPQRMRTIQNTNPCAFIAWIGASGFGYATEQGLAGGITGVTSCDSVLIGFVLYVVSSLVLSWALPQQQIVH